MAEREREFRDGRSLEIRGDMTQPREVRIVEEREDQEEPHSYHIGVKSPHEDVLVVTPCYHVEGEDGEEEIVPDHEQAQEFSSGNAFLHHVRKITHLPSRKLKR